MDDARGLVAALGIAACVTLGITVGRYVWTPMRFDEADFADQAQGTLRHGTPKILPAEDRLVQPHGYLGYGARYGLWHPPVYLYSLAASLALFGVGDWQLRMVGLLWFGVSLWLGTRLLRRAPGLAGPRSPPLAIGVALALALLTPLLMEGSLAVDIDNTSLTASLLLWLWVYVRAPDQFTLRRSLVLALIFTGCLWSKLTSPFLLLAGTVLYQGLRGHWGRGVLQGITVAVLGTALFALTYRLYCWGTAYPPAFMFEFTYGPRRYGYAAASSLPHLLQALRWHVVWLSPAVTLLFGTVAVSRVRTLWRRRPPDVMDLLLIVCLLGLATYVVWAGRWGKYSMPFVLAGILVVGHDVAGLLTPLQLRRRVMLAILLGGLLAFHLAWVPSLRVRPPGLDLHVADAWRLLQDPRHRHLGLTLGAFVLFVGGLRRWVVQEPRRAWVTALLCYAIVANPVEVAKAAATSDDRSPYRPLQERGFLATAAFLNRTLTAQDLILVPKDLGRYVTSRYLPLDNAVVCELSTEAPSLLRPGRVRYVVDSAKYPAWAGLDPWVRRGILVPVQQVGDFVVYEVREERS